MKSNSDRRVVIVGGGLVGALQACFLSKRGFQVDVYEKRPDIRLEQTARGRSINLALSCRGRSALAAVGMEETVIKAGIPMYARMIHDLDGTRRPIPYGTIDQYIMSVDRRKLNEVLLTEAEKRPGVRLFFNHKVIKLDVEKPEAVFIDSDGKQVRASASLIIGCDGAYSVVRSHLMNSTRFNYNQEYIPHGYMELKIQATPSGEFTMEKNFLHIWPRNTFMLIGLPNTADKSFVMTLFMPFDKFEEVNNKDKVLEFFKQTFPDALPLIGEKLLVEDYLSSKPLPLISIKSTPYHYKGKVVLLGDAAHAVVPFYGQGMNCGFEDCLVFEDMMNLYHDDFDKVLPAFTEHRCPDAHAICDLAKYNYIEMRSLVNSRMFLLRKRVDNLLFWLFPNTWIPLYTMVSFTRTRYHECIARRKWQDHMLNRLVVTSALLSAGCAALFAWKLTSNGHVGLPNSVTIWGHTLGF